MTDKDKPTDANMLRRAKQLLHEAFDEMCHIESWVKRARALGVKGDPCGAFELRARNAPVDDWAVCGYPYQQGYVAGRDRKRRDCPRRGPSRGLWESGYDAGRQEKPA